jgi:secreted PhoX family phosphatase
VDIITTANIVWVQNFSGPAGIAFDSSGGLWVAQYAADSIIKVGNAFSTNAELVNATTTITSTAMLQPNAIAFDNQGKLWVTTNNGASASSGSGKLIKLDPATGGGQNTPAASLSVAAGATGLAFNLHPSGLLLNGRP